MALRVLRQEAIRPIMKGGNFPLDRQHHHLSRPDFVTHVHADHRRIDTRCPTIDRGLEARIRESLARSGLLRDCPEPEYVTKPAIQDPAIVAYGPITSRHEPSYHRKTRSHSSMMELSEEILRGSGNEVPRDPVMIDNPQMNMRRKERRHPFKESFSSGVSQQTQTYRGVESKFQALKRRDQNRSYDDEVGPKFLTKEDYTPTKRIIGYYVDPPAGAARNTRKVTARASEPLVENILVSPKKTSKASSEPNIPKQEANDEIALPAPAQMIVDVTENRSKTSCSLLNPVERPSPMKMVKIIDVKNNTSASPPRSPNEKSGSNSEPQVMDDIIGQLEDVIPEKVEKRDPLEDCIRSLATWNKGDRAKLQKLLEVLKSMNIDDSPRPSSPTNTIDTTIRSPRRERKSYSSLNPHAACFNDFSSVREHTSESRKEFHQRQELNMPMGPVWVKTEANKFIRPPPGLPIPIRVPVDKVPSEDDEGRMAFPMDQRISEPLLARFLEKYPLTGTTAPTPLPPPPTELKTAAQIQEQLERLLLQEKEKKAFKKFL
ncbi:hypothetical protein ACMFMF_002271 [Clarireedia jacksonii]